MSEVHELFGKPKEISYRVRRQLEAAGKPIPKPTMTYDHLGMPITLHDLPPSGPVRWGVGRKLMVIALVKAGILPVDDLWKMYKITAKEFRQWQADFDSGGLAALKASKAYVHPAVESDIASCDNEAIPKPQDILQYNGVVLDFNRRELRKDNGDRVHLTKKETEILSLLLRRPGEVVTKEVIFNNLYGGEDFPKQKTIDVFVCKLRKKTKQFRDEFFIETAWGRGYCLTGPIA